MSSPHLLGAELETTGIRAELPILPRFRCSSVIVSTVGGEDVELWAFPCPACNTLHVTHPRPGHVPTLCWTDAGRRIYRDGYWIEGPRGEGTSIDVSRSSSS